MEELFNFGAALRRMREGLKLSREGWNGKGMWAELQKPDAHSKMTRHYIFLCVPNGKTSQFAASNEAVDRVPWLPSQTDLLAEDWFEVVN